MTDDPAWDAAASDRFNATFDARAAEVDLFGAMDALLAFSVAHAHIDTKEPPMVDIKPGDRVPCEVCGGLGYTGDRYMVTDAWGEAREEDERVRCAACEGTGYAALGIVDEGVPS